MIANRIDDDTNNKAIYRSEYPREERHNRSFIEVDVFGVHGVTPGRYGYLVSPPPRISHRPPAKAMWRHSPRPRRRPPRGCVHVV